MSSARSLAEVKSTEARGILNNSLYVGRIEWNRCSYVKDPSGKRVARPNPKDLWEVVGVPKLRIIDDDLWEAVRLRQRELSFDIRRDEGGNALIEFTGASSCYPVCSNVAAAEAASPSWRRLRYTSQQRNLRQQHDGEQVGNRGARPWRAQRETSGA